MLTIQYRMHEDIMTWSSTELYKGRLQADPYVCLDHTDCPGTFTRLDYAAGWSLDMSCAACRMSRRRTKQPRHVSLLTQPGVHSTRQRALTTSQRFAASRGGQGYYTHSGQESYTASCGCVIEHENAFALRPTRARRVWLYGMSSACWMQVSYPARCVSGSALIVYALLTLA